MVLPIYCLNFYFSNLYIEIINCQRPLRRVYGPSEGKQIISTWSEIMVLKYLGQKYNNDF